MLRLLALACLLAAAAAQTRYYCNSLTPSTIRSRDFYLFTRRNSSEFSYPEGLSCDFNAELEATYNAYFVEIESFSVSTAVLTISADSRQLFRGSSLQSYQSTIATPLTWALRIRFNATGDNSRSSGVRIRVRTFQYNGCPPNWTLIASTCFGKSTTAGDQNYTDAQKACNNMRSNLLQVPLTYRDNIASFVRMLPSNMKSGYTWIGLTDRTAYGQYKPYWLNGARQYSTSEISCKSGGSYSSCYSYERCGTIYDKSFYYAVFMGNCSYKDEFACSMPPGGTGVFDQVPDYNVIPTTTYVPPTPYVRPTPYVPLGYVGISAWIWGVVVAGVFVVGLIVAGIYSAVRSSHMRRTPGAASVVVSTGRITIPPPTTCPPSVQRPPYPQQYPLQYPQQYPQQYPAGQQVSTPPPAYNVVVGLAYNNPGFQSSQPIN